MLECYAISNYLQLQLKGFHTSKMQNALAEVWCSDFHAGYMQEYFSCLAVAWHCVLSRRNEICITNVELPSQGCHNDR